MLIIATLLLMFMGVIMVFRPKISSFFGINHASAVVLFLFSFLIVYFISSAFVQANIKDYVIGPQDVLKIEVWDNPDLSREVTVSLRDTISFPLIGEISVKGHTAEELQRIIKSHLADGYLVNPQVTVTIKEYNSQKVYVLGEVNKPGYYPFSKATSLVEIISMAGGLTPDAGGEAYILRSPEKIKLSDFKRLIDRSKDNLPFETSVDSLSTSPKKGSSASLKSQVITINLDDFSQGLNLRFELQNNDTLYIPKAKFFYVIGEVKSPGRFKLEKEVNILQAISMAGGLTQKASEKKTKIVRTVDGEDQEIKAKMTDLVLPDDIIKVPESFF